jgi:hypothetical protein
MNSMKETEIKEFKYFVRDTLMNKYHMNEIEATRAVRDSYLSYALKMDKDFVEHDTVEEWADFIYNEVNQSELLMM